MENRDLICYGQPDPFRKSADEMLRDLEKKIKFRRKKTGFAFSLPTKKTVLVMVFLVVLSSLFFIASNRVSHVQVDNLAVDRLWEYKTLAPVFATPALADLDGDGKNEVIANSMDGKLYVLDGTTGRRHFFFETGSPLLASPIVRKTEKTGNWIILAGQDKAVYALDQNGKCQWSSIRQDFESSVISTPVLGDFSGGKSADVVLAATDGKIYLLNGDRGWLVWKSQETSGRFFSTPLLAKINQDKTPDVVVGSPNKSLYALDGKTGLKLWERSLNGPINSSPVAIDAESLVVCDESGILHHLRYETGTEIKKMDLKSSVIATPSLLNKDVAPVLVVPLKDGSVKALAVSDFKLLWEYDTKYQDPIVASPAHYDFNADGCEDVVITSRNGYLYLLDGKNGKELVAPFFAGNSVSSSPVLGDINGDGYLDIVFGSENGNLMAVTVKTVPDKLIRRNSIVHGSFLNRGNDKI